MYPSHRLLTVFLMYPSPRYLHACHEIEVSVCPWVFKYQAYLQGELNRPWHIHGGQKSSGRSCCEEQGPVIVCWMVFWWLLWHQLTVFSHSGCDFPGSGCDQ